MGYLLIYPPASLTLSFSLNMINVLNGHVVGGWVMIYPSKTVQAPPVQRFSSSVGNSTFLDLDQIGKYCLFLSVFSSIFCSHVECSSYIYLYIYYITYYVYQKKKKPDVDKKIQSNR